MRKNQSIHPKALQDLEFDQILMHIAVYAQSETAKNRVLKTIPFVEREPIETALHKTNEYLTSLESDNPLPYHYINTFDEVLKKLDIENSFIEPKSLLNIAQAVDILIGLKRFFTKLAGYFPNLLQEIEQLKIHSEIAKTIHKKIDAYGDIKDTA